MRAIELPIALLALLALVAFAPAVSYWTTGAPAQGLPAETQVLAAFAMPVVALLFLASYLEPGV